MAADFPHDLTIEEGMEAWLATLPEDQRRDAAVVIAARAAARALPFVWGSWAEDHRDDWRHLQLATCRAILTSASAAVGPTADVTRATASVAGANAAGAAARATTNAEARATANAANAANAAGATANAAGAYAAGAARANAAYASASATANPTEADAQALETTEPASVLASPLWPGRQSPSDAAYAWTACRGAMMADEAEWSFWIAWYEGWLDGRLPAKDLAEEIVTSPEIDWKNPIAANAKIVEIWQRHRGASAGPDPDKLPKLKRKKLRQQVEFLLETGAQTTVTAQALSEQLKAALDRWCNEHRVNELPDDLLVFRRFQETFAHMAATVEGDLERDAKIAALERDLLRVTEDRDRWHALARELQTATDGEARRLVVTGVLSAGLGGALATGIVHLTSGIASLDEVQALGRMAQDFIAGRGP